MIYFCKPIGISLVPAIQKANGIFPFDFGLLQKPVVSNRLAFQQVRNVEILRQMEDHMNNTSWAHAWKCIYLFYNLFRLQVQLKM